MSWFKNQQTDLIQKTAWRLVRSAEDRFRGLQKGQEKYLWCLEEIKKIHPKVTGSHEDYVRAAYQNFKIEKG